VNIYVYPQDIIIIKEEEKYNNTLKMVGVPTSTAVVQPGHMLVLSINKLHSLFLSVWTFG
jgi:hypothetical protein